MLLQVRLLSTGSTIWAYAMTWFSNTHVFFNRQGNDSGSDLGKLVPLLIRFPIFQASHFSFKFVYALNQRGLRLLRSEDFFLKFYDSRIPARSIVDVLQSLRYVKSGLNSAETSKQLTHHDVSSPERAVKQAQLTKSPV